MKISRDKNTFDNPFDSSRKVHVFGDVPHLKLTRNHFSDHDFQSVNDEETIKCDPVKELFGVDGVKFEIGSQTDKSTY